MNRRTKPVCFAESVDAPADLRAHLRDRVERHGWALTSVFTHNPYAIGFTYTTGLETKDTPELIVFGAGHDRLLNAVATKVVKGKRWDAPFELLLDGKQVQLLPIAARWRMAHALATVDYWAPEAFRLWQVRLPRRDGTFAEDGACCRVPCQPLLDRDDPWLPVTHDPIPAATATLWHRAVEGSGAWTGRWECLGGVPLGSDLYQVAHVPYLADDVGILDVVEARVEPSGRLVIHDIALRSDYRTVRVTCDAGDEAGQARVDRALERIAADDGVVWQCGHLPPHLRYWTFAMHRDDVGWLEDVLRPLRREGLVSYEVLGADGADGA
jgi:hypothetical protein